MSNNRFCSECGNPIPTGSAICPNCGSPVAGNSQTTPPAYGSQPISTPPTAPQRNNTLMIVIIVLLALLIGGLIAALIIFTRDDDSKTKVEETTITVADTLSGTTLAASQNTAPVVEEATPVVEEAPAPAPKRRSSPYDYVMTGSIGKYKIQMEISISGGSISGRYRYNRMKGAGGWLTLSGYTNGSSFDMEEYTNGGRNTGTFSGTYRASVDHLSMSGYMWNEKGDQYSFNVSGSASE